MFKNMKIWMRFLLGFTSVLVFMIAIILVGLYQMRASGEKLKRIVEINNTRIYLATEMASIARDNSISIRNIILARNDIGTISAMQDTIDGRWERYDKDNKTLHELTPVDDVEGLALMNNADIAEKSTRSENNKTLELAVAGKYNDALVILNSQARNQRIQWLIDLDMIVQYNKDRNHLRYQEAIKAAAEARTFMILLGVLALMFSIIIAFILTTSITKPIKIATTLVSSRDLSMDISAYMTSKNELALMIQSFRKDIAEKLAIEKELVSKNDQLEERTANLTNVLTEVKETVNFLASSASQILAATTQVASGTAETATAISETTATVEEVQQAAKLSAQKAKNVADSAEKLAQVSHDGQKAVDESVKGMNRIREQMNSIAQIVIRLSEQSQSIGGIIASVADIADQSNLLAVNAAIEAAKAGEQGKGFAVVAREIKNLAEQSKQSTSQVRNILNDIQKVTSAAVMATEQGSNAVEAGVKQTALAGDAIRILAESSNEAVQAATQIVASSQQQVIGMDQIGVAMQNINQAGTETAVSMLESEKAAKSLHDLGLKLKDMVEKFKV
jgi:methyl-accepting chemotaxis protein